MIDLTPAGYVVLGDTASVATLEAEQALTDRLPRDAADALDLETLRPIDPAIAKTTAKAAIAQLCSKSTVHRLGTGKRGDAYRYFLSITDSVATQTHRFDQ